MDQADAAAYAPGGTPYVYSPDGSTFLGEVTSWPPSGTYDVISKIDAYLPKEQSCQISFRSDLKQLSL